MAGNFLYLGISTAATTSKLYPDIDPTAGSTAYTHVDSSNLSTVTLGPVASSALVNAYVGLGIYVVSGSGVGQMRRIRKSDTAAQTIATLKLWDQPRPDSGSIMVVGVMQDGRDGLAVKVEYAGTAATGAFRGAFWTREDAPRLVFTTPFSLGGIGSAAMATGAGSMVTTAAIHGETRIIDYLDPMYRIGKIAVESAPTADVHLFAAAVWTMGRNPNR